MEERTFEGVVDTLYIPPTARIYVSKRLLEYFYDPKSLELEPAILGDHGDVRAYTLDKVRAFSTASGLSPVTLEAQKKFRLHLVVRKPTSPLHH